MEKTKIFPDTEKKLAIIRRYLHILALLQNNKDPVDWNGTTLADVLHLDEPAVSLTDKSVRDYIKKHLVDELDINVDVEKGGRRIELAEPVNPDVLEKIISVYASFVVSDSTMKIVLRHFIRKHPYDCLWMLGKIYFAALSRNSVKFDYVTNSGYKINNCVFNPYHIVCRNNNLYLLGRQVEKEKTWLLVLSRIDNLRLTDEYFEDTVPGIDDIFKDTLGSFIGQKYSVKLRFKKEVLQPLEQFLSILEPEITALDGGEMYEAAFTVSDERYLCKQLFLYGSDVEILEPQIVRDIMVEMLDESRGVYG